MYPIHTIDRLQAEGIEYLGTKRKFWFTREDKRRYLFKAEERGTGEDWAEKVVCELAALLGLPHVEYELAHEFEADSSIQPGVICPNFAPPPLALVMGNQLLFRQDSHYPAQSATKYGVREHTVPAVVKALAALRPPTREWMRGAPEKVDTAAGVFCGYVMLDAWVANQDRHHLNWGAIQDERGALSLAPTYDHGSSLARLLTDKDRQERLESRDMNRIIEFFVKRARSGFYLTHDDKKTMLALDVFYWFAEREPVAAKAWLSKLNSINPELIDAIASEVPPTRMSPLTKEFTLRLLTINRQRLLEGYSP